MKKSKFIIVEHKAQRAGTHFDIRFKKPNSNIWDSFACRKDIPLESGVKRMIIKTHPHSEKEALFTGTISSGYGAGRLTKWDGGSCKILKYSNAHMIIDFSGSKIKGIYHIISMGMINKKFKGKTYLFFKGNK